MKLINLKTHSIPFKKLKFYNIIIKMLLTQNNTSSLPFQYLLFYYFNVLTLVNKYTFSKTISPVNASHYSRTLFQKGSKEVFSSSKTGLLKGSTLTNSTSLEIVKLFKLFLKLSLSQPFFYSRYHYSHRLLFNTLNPNEVVYVDLGKSYSRWFSLQTLLTNLFYYNIKIASFGTKLLADEILALNWRLTFTNLTTHSLFTKSFFFNSAKTGPVYSKSFLRLSKFNIENAFVFDLTFHQRTIFFLRRYNFFTFGLVTSAQNPWLVDYPILVSSSSLLIQYYFIKLFTYTFSSAKYLYFNNCKTLWLKLYI